MTCKWREYAQLMRLDKPIGTFLLLWPTLWALWIANAGIPPWPLLLIFTLGTFVMRSTGCVINDFADKDIDAKVARTQSRPLARQAVSARETLILFASLIVCAAVLLCFLPLRVWPYAVCAVLLTIIYPYSKRFFQMPQMVLGIAFAWAIPMAFAASQAHVPWIAWALFALTLLWVISYDTLYAMADRDDDQHLPIYSSALLFAQYDRLIIALLQLIFVCGMIFLGRSLQFNSLYYLSLFVVVLMFMYQHYSIRDRQAPACFAAFLANNWIGFVIFTGIVLSYSS